MLTRNVSLAGRGCRRRSEGQAACLGTDGLVSAAPVAAARPGTPLQGPPGRGEPGAQRGAAGGPRQGGPGFRARGLAAAHLLCRLLFLPLYMCTLYRLHFHSRIPLEDFAFKAAYSLTSQVLWFLPSSSVGEEHGL